MNLDALSFPEPGTYSFVFTLNNDELARLTFRITGPPGSSFLKRPLFNPERRRSHTKVWLFNP